MMAFKIIVLVVFFPLILNGKNIKSISGIIQDESGLPILDAIVQITDFPNLQAAKSKENGSFTIDLEVEINTDNCYEISICVLKNGYLPIKTPVHLLPSGVIAPNIIKISQDPKPAIIGYIENPLKTKISISNLNNPNNLNLQNNNLVYINYAFKAKRITIVVKAVGCKDTILEFKRKYLRNPKCFVLKLTSLADPLDVNFDPLGLNPIIKVTETNINGTKKMKTEIKIDQEKYCTIFKFDCKTGELIYPINEKPTSSSCYVLPEFYTEKWNKEDKNKRLIFVFSTTPIGTISKSYDNSEFLELIDKYKDILTIKTVIL